MRTKGDVKRKLFVTYIYGLVVSTLNVIKTTKPEQQRNNSLRPLAMYVNPDRQANSQTDEFNIQLSLISSWVVCGRVRRAWMDGYDVSCACVSLLRVFARRLVALYIYYIIIITMCYTHSGEEPGIAFLKQLLHLYNNHLNWGRRREPTAARHGSPPPLSLTAIVKVRTYWPSADKNTEQSSL